MLSNDRQLYVWNSCSSVNLANSMNLLASNANDIKNRSKLSRRLRWFINKWRKNSYHGSAISVHVFGESLWELFQHLFLLSNYFDLFEHRLSLSHTLTYNVYIYEHVVQLHPRRTSCNDKQKQPVFVRTPPPHKQQWFVVVIVVFLFAIQK